MTRYRAALVWLLRICAALVLVFAVYGTWQTSQVTSAHAGEVGITRVEMIGSSLLPGLLAALCCLAAAEGLAVLNAMSKNR